METEIPVTNHAEGERKAAILQLILGLLCLSLLFGAVATSSDSLWIDEGFSAFFANQPDFAGYVSAMKHELGSDAQTPFYTFYLWAWRHGFGASEHSLRLANLPWVLLGQGALLVAMGRAGMQRRKLVLYITAAALSPFLAFYLNQARCYVMQYGTACMVLAYLIEISASARQAFEPRTLFIGLAGVVLLCGTSLLGVPWAGAAVLAAVWILWKNRGNIPRPSPAAWSGLAVFVIILGLLGTYYLGTLLRGARATGGETNLGSILYCAYEILGLAGLGPNRNELRQLGVHAVGTLGPGLLLAAAVVSGTLIWGGIIRFRRGLPLSIPVKALGFALLPLVFVFGEGAAVHFRVLGRHIIAGFPLILWLITLALEELFKTRRKILPVLFLAVWATSAGLLRFSERHQREDYRGAALTALANVNEGKTVWWVADRLTGEYYGLDFSLDKGARNLRNLDPQTAAALPAPHRIFLSKPEIYDATGALRGYMETNGYTPVQTFTAFTVFEKRP